MEKDKKGKWIGEKGIKIGEKGWEGRKERKGGMTKGEKESGREGRKEEKAWRERGGGGGGHKIFILPRAQAGLALTLRDFWLFKNKN